MSLRQTYKTPALKETEMTSPPTFSVMELPKLHPGDREKAPWMLLAERYRALRLRSLKVAPEAFASTYEVESQRGLDRTLDRLSNPKARHFVAVAGERAGQLGVPSDVNIEDICEREWVGMIVLIGPIEDSIMANQDPLKTAASGGEQSIETTSADDQRRRGCSVEFVINGIFVELAVRGQGIGKALVDTALAQARSRGVGQGTDICVTVLVNEENQEAHKLYERAGFEVVGREFYRQESGGLSDECRAEERVALKMRLVC